MKRKSYRNLSGETISRKDCNQQIKTLIQQKEKKGESYTALEKQFISQYSGAGGFGRNGATGTGEFYEYYTPVWLCKSMWDLAQHHGFKGSTVLDPAIGTGNFLCHAPNPAKFTGFEISPVSHRIASILYPKLL